MSSWYMNERSKILEALSGALSEACGRIDEQINSEIDVINSERSEAFEERDHALSKVYELRTENARLKAQLQKAQDSKNPAPSRHEPSKDASNSPGEDSSKDGTNWKRECAKVSHKFTALSENFKKAKDALRKRKEERDKWIDHATVLEKKIKAVEEEYGIQILDRNMRGERATSHLSTKGDSAGPSPNASFASEEGLEQTDLELPPLAAEFLHSEETGPQPIVTPNPQSESTEGDSDSREDDLPAPPTSKEASAVMIKEEPSSDAPVVVSERAVKKRKRGEDESNATPVQRVKLEEDASSSLVQALAQDSLDLQESIDLGDVAQKITTPRKRKGLEEWRQPMEIQAQPTEGATAAASATAAAATTTTITTTTPNQLYVRPDSNPTPTRAYPQSARAADRNSALTPVSANRRMPPPASEKPRAPVARGLTRGIASLAEDGGLYKRAAAAALNDAITPAPKGRLDALLNSPAAREEPATISGRASSTRSLSENQHRSMDDPSIPKRRELPFEKAKSSKDRPADQPTSSKGQISSRLARLEPQVAKSPLAHKDPTGRLRNKPPSELRPDDFKINPQANEGHDFAYSEVVRDRDERGCLPGCTDMHCCGKQFRALALSQRPNPPLTAAQRQEEQKLLEGYLGDVSYRLATMSKEERDELWVEAKTQELANKYGKHRHRFSRARSPPGFWNADFPTTQELEAERAEAGKRERQIVQERYREATRPGGRWLFKDE